MKIENRTTYKFFKTEFEELLKSGFSKEQACLILKRIHHAIYCRYVHNDSRITAGQSLDYFIHQIEDEATELELKEHILDNAITYGFRPEEAQDRAEVSRLSVGDVRRNGRVVYA